MALSGSNNFNLSASEIVQEAFKICGILPQEQQLQNAEIQDGLNALNMMLKGWQNQFQHLWMEKEGIVFLDKTTSKYSIGLTGDHTCYDSDLVETTLSAAESSGQTVLSVTSSSGMTASDYVGILLDDGTRQWTTISTVDSATQITVSAALTGDAASGNTVFSYTSKIDRPSAITQVRRKTYNVDSEIELFDVSRKEYFAQTTKSTNGTPLMYYYDPQRTNGELRIWQPTDTANRYLKITFIKYLDDLDANNDDIEIPSEWFECVAYNLAARIAGIYSVPVQLRAEIKEMAVYFLDQAMAHDNDRASIVLNPNRGYYR